MSDIVNWRFSTLALCVALLVVGGACAQPAPKLDSSLHQVQLVTVDKDVRLEVLDWGGNGPPLIFLAGLGDTAHVFDTFAPRFTAGHHVYGITRRGFGKSSAPPPTEENYAADRLGDDVLAVIDTLRLDRPVLAGHSIAGEELSSVGSRHPEKIAGLVYLEAGLAYAYYDPAHSEGGLIVDANELRRELDLLMLNQTMVGAIRDISQGNLVWQFDKDLQVMLKQFQGIPTPASGTPAQPLSPGMQVSVAISKGERKYTGLKCPILDLIAWPSDPGPPIRAQASAFEGIPSAHVVRVLNADHYIFRSNEADVEREMNAFMNRLNPTKPRAAKAFDAWLLALTASDRSRMGKVLEEYHLRGTAESLMNFARRTGGLNVLRVEQSTQDRLTAVVGERNSDTIARGTLVLTADASGQVVKGELDFRVMPREGEFRYQVRCTILTSQLPVSRWHEQIGALPLADGILDRLVHNASHRDAGGIDAKESRQAKRITPGKPFERGIGKHYATRLVLSCALVAIFFRSVVSLALRCKPRPGPREGLNPLACINRCSVSEPLCSRSCGPSAINAWRFFDGPVTGAPQF